MDKQQMGELGTQVKAARQERGWSQERLAKEAGVSANTVGSLELGKHETQGEKVRKILDALDIHPTATLLDLGALPKDIQAFIRVSTERLLLLDEDTRARTLADLYPRLLLMSS